MIQGLEMFKDKVAYIECIECGISRSVDISKNNLEKYRKLYPRCNPCSKIGLVNSGQFKRGVSSWNKGIKRWWASSGEFKKGYHYSSATEFKKGEQINENNPKWVGDEVGYGALHSWIQRKLGKAYKCSNCDI